MSKKELFEVETIDTFTVKSFDLMSGLVHTGINGCISIKKLPQIPEIPTVETGILMSPAEITDSDSVVELRFSGDKLGYVYSKEYGKRLVISEYDFPKKWYTDIQKTFDFSAIPANAVIEVVKNQHKARYGRFEGLAGKRLLIFGHWAVPVEEIKSIRIIELARGEK